MTKAAPRKALVFGATGFLGRWLIVELVGQGIQVTAAVRSTESAARLNDWLANRGVIDSIPSVVVDFGSDDLGLSLDSPHLHRISEVHNLSGAYRFGMSAKEAHDGNVVTARRIVMLASRLEGSPRLVHVSGYRVGSHGDSPASEIGEATYARLGAYEASKVEADRVVQATAKAEGVPFTIVNPSTVTGISATGESDQQVGLAASIRDLWFGNLAALPGDHQTFVPVVTVDHLARFMALVPTVPEAAGQSYWVLDDDTPALPDLLQMIGRHYQVAVPRLRIPVGLVKRLPSRVSKAHPETLSFMSSKRYPTDAARALAGEHGLRQPETRSSILKWADHLAAHRFADVSATALSRGFTSNAGIHTFSIGDPAARTLVLPPIPVNADTWAPMAAGMSEPTRVLDLPGLGMSAGDEGRWLDWLAEVVDGRDGVHLVGHSIGAAVATEFAAGHPEQVERLTLVAPAFLQPAPPLLHRLIPLTSAYFRIVGAPRLARTLLGTEEFAEALETSVTDLRRRGVARRVGRILARGARRSRREDLIQRLIDYPGEVQVIVGEHDPLSLERLAKLAPLGDRLRVTTIAGAGHYPNLTHPTQLLDAIESFVTVPYR